jgi:hypothetical protein
MLFGRTSGKSEVVRATDLYTVLDGCLFLTLLHVSDVTLMY